MKFKFKIFKNKKIIPLDQFINRSLYDEQYGFYMKKNPFGYRGDFITSPGVSILFSEMIAVWCISFWEKLGYPKKINILELGPGDGSLSVGLLNTFKNFKKFNLCFRIILFEKSKHLINIQKKKINCNKIKWINNLNQIDSSPTIVIANEFFDALPIKQYILKKKKWYERYVRLSKSERIEICDKQTKLPNFKKICNVDIQKNQKFIEYSRNAYKYLKTICKIIKKNNGGLLCFDYGYKNKKTFNSLQAVKKHTFSDVLLNPGESDITYLINFSILSELIQKLDLDVAKINTQGNFLKNTGIIERANILTANSTFKYKADIFYRVRRLIHPNEMGHTFKVLFAQKKNINFKLGF